MPHSHLTQPNSLEERFANDMQRIIFINLALVATVHRGTKEDDWGGVDMIAPSRTFGCRVRNNYAIRYDDVTLRSRTRHNVPTECHRLRDGNHPDAFVYAWADKSGLSLERWVMVDLHTMRAHLAELNWTRQANGDGTEFYAFPIAELRAIGAVLCSNYQTETFQAALPL